MTKQPNILLLFTDQQRFDTIAALGNPLIRTPTLDRLCREGTAFTRAFTPSPVCVPARAALVTGLPPHLNACVDNNNDVNPSLPSFMDVLGEHGYQTHGVGKMHFTPDPGRSWGFQSRDFSEEGFCGDQDDYLCFLRNAGYSHVEDAHGVRSEYYYIPQPSQVPATLHHTHWTVDRSIDFLKRRDRSRPFFLWTSFIKPHPPFESPTPWNKLYRANEFSAPFRPGGYEDLLGYWNRVQNRYKYRDQGHDDLLLRTMRAAYYASISYIDAQLARLIGALGDEIDNTLILFAADHGELLGDYGGVGKRCMLDAAARVPLLARWPSVFRPGGRVDTPATLLDLWPTFLAAANITHRDAHHREGLPLQELAAGAAPDRIVHSQFQHGGYGLYMGVSARGKYIYSAPDQREWLLDPVNDALETRDAAADPAQADTLATLRDACIRRFQSDGYTEPLDGDTWRRYPRRKLPADADTGLLFQDAPDLQDRIDALDEGYRRTVTVQDDVSLMLLNQPESESAP